MTRLPIVLAAFLSVCTFACAAPDAKAPIPTTFEIGRVYRLEYTLAAKGGADARPTTYALSVEEGRGAGLRAGDNVALPSGARTDTGIRLGCRYAMQGESLVVHSEFEMSALAADQALHKVTASGDSLVTPGTPTLVARVEDPATRTQYDLNVAATRVR